MFFTYVRLACSVGLAILFFGSFGLQAEDGVEARVQRLEEMLNKQQAMLKAQGEKLKARDAKIEEFETVFNDRKTMAQLDQHTYFTTAKDSGGKSLNTMASWFDKGMRFKSADGAHSFKLGGRIMQDWRWGSFEDEYEQLSLQSEDGTEMRRARFYMAGTYYSNVFWKAQFDFANGGVVTKDLFLGLKNLPLIGNWKVGHFKEPFSLEEQTSSKYITFIERALPIAFSPGRNPGMMFFNNHLDQRLTWAAGVFREASDTKIQDDDGYNGTARITGLPYYEDGGKKLVHVGLAASFRKPNNNSVRFRGRPEVHLSNRLVDTGTYLAESSNRIGAELAWVWGPASLQAEYSAAWADRTDRAIDTDGDGLDDTDQRSAGNTFFSGGYVQFSYWITGEHRKYKKKSGAFSRVSPKKNFWDGKNSMGAIELAIRYSYLDLTDEDRDGGRLNNFTAGVNWHLNPNTRFMLNYVHAGLDRKYTDVNGFDRTLNGVNSTVMMRFQIDF